MVKSLTVSLTLTLALIAASVSAQQVEVSVEKQQMLAAGQTIDANAAQVGSSRATSKIVEQWQGTTFTFDKGDAPRELTAQDVQDYRAKGLGYGGISILLALAANQDGTDPRSVNEILAMRQTDRMGWGNVAKALGYKSLGAVVSSVKKTDPILTAEKAEKGAKPAKTAKPEKTAKIDKADRPDRPEKVEKVEKMERVERVERIERPERKTK